MKQKMNENKVLNILSLEDSPQDFEIIRELLIDAGYNPMMERVETENDFIASLRRHTYDIILADFNLPDFDAFTALQKSIEILPNIPFICVSGSIGEEKAIELLKSGAVDYVLKGKPQRLPLAIKRALDEVRDKEAHKRDEEALKHTHDELKNLHDNLDEAIFSFDAVQNKMLQVSAAHAVVFGYPPAEFFKNSQLWYECIIPGDKPIVDAGYSVLMKGKSLQHEVRIIRADKQMRWIEAKMKPTLDANGKLVHIDGIVSDITERKQAEENLRMQSAALNAAANAILISDNEGKIKWVNQAFTVLTGYKTEEAIGKNPRELMKSGQHNNAFYKQFWDTILSGKIWTGELINRRKDGTIYTEEQTVTPLPDVSGKIQNFIAIKQDITERKMLEERLREMQKLEGLGTLAGGIAHDFNNILGIILAYITSTTRFKDDPKKLDITINTIVKAVERGKTLVRQILTFARKTETAFGAVDINDVVMEIMTMIMETFPKILTYAQDFDKTIPYINADRSQLHQALLNLCVNARDAMPKGGVLSINTRMVSTANLCNLHPDAVGSSYVCIEVSDSGEGMTEEIQKRIFEPFFTTKGIGKGTGLGLAMVFGIIQTHKGFIDVESELQEGTTFRLYLPASQVAEPISENEEGTIDEIPGGTETLLVVEDEEMLMMSLQMVLVEKGYKVLSAEDGFVALKIYQERKNDIALVLTDLGLPNISGREVCQRIKEINTNERIILATGFLDPEMKAEFLKVGIRHFLFKPYDLKKVLKMVREVLDEK